MILLVGAGAIIDLKSVDGKKWEAEAEENGYNAEKFRKIIFQYHSNARLLSALKSIILSPGMTNKRVTVSGSDFSVSPELASVRCPKVLHI